VPFNTGNGCLCGAREEKREKARTTHQEEKCGNYGPAARKRKKPQKLFLKGHPDAGRERSPQNAKKEV